MPRKKAQRLVALLAIVVVLCFAFETAGHWHTDNAGDAQCQVCHLAHSVSFGVAPALLVVPAMVPRLVLPDAADREVEQQYQQISPRAPPAIQLF